MSAPTSSRNFSAPNRVASATHIYAVGQKVRMRDGFIDRTRSSGIYRITGTLPPKGDALQYRIRDETEPYDRVTTQESLEPVSASVDDKTSSISTGVFHRG